MQSSLQRPAGRPAWAPRQWKGRGRARPGIIVAPGLARDVFARPELQGGQDYAALLKTTEAYWQVGGWAITAALMPGETNAWPPMQDSARPHSPGNAPLPPATACAPNGTRIVLQALRKQQHEPGKAGPTVVRTQLGQRLPSSQPPTFDLVVCGGTLGIFLATALQLRGFR